MRTKVREDYCRLGYEVLSAKCRVLRFRLLAANLPLL